VRLTHVSDDGTFSEPHNIDGADVTSCLAYGSGNFAKHSGFGEKLDSHEDLSFPSSRGRSLHRSFSKSAIHIKKREVD